MRFFDTDRWNEIWQTISRNRKRSIMTALGVFWGIFMLIVLLGAGMGLGRLFRAQLGGMSTNTVLLQSSRTSVPYKGMPTGRWWRMDNDDLEAVSKLEEVEYTSGVIWGNELHCSYKERKGDYQMMGYTPDYQKINPQKIIAGRYINEVDMVHKRKVCVIGTQVQKDLFPGEPDPTGKVIKVGGSYFTIIGVMRRESSAMSFSDVERTVVVPISLAQQMFGYGRTIHLLALAGYKDVPSKQVEKAAREAVFARHMISPDDEKAAWTMSAGEMFDKVMSLFWGIGLLTWIVGLGTLLAGIVGVSNIMLVLVKEHAGDRHPPRAGRPAYGHHLADTFRELHPHLHRRNTGAHGRRRRAVGRGFGLLSGGHRGAGRIRSVVADLLRDGHAGPLHPDRRQPAGGRHPRIPGLEHQGGGCNTRRIND